LFFLPAAAVMVHDCSLRTDTGLKRVEVGAGVRVSQTHTDTARDMGITDPDPAMATTVAMRPPYYGYGRAPPITGGGPYYYGGYGYRSGVPRFRVVKLQAAMATSGTMESDQSLH